MVDEDTETYAVIRRDLIRAANLDYRFDPIMVSGLLRYAVFTYPPEITEHPSYPLGLIYAWAASNGVDLSHYENKKLPDPS